MKKTNRKAVINIEVQLNANNVPEVMSWAATDNENKENYAKAILVSLWDFDKKNSFNIDLWTKDMPVEEMKFFIFQNLLKMSGVLEKSTGDKNLVDSMKQFSEKFGKEANLIKNE